MDSTGKAGSLNALKLLSVPRPGCLPENTGSAQARCSSGWRCSDITGDAAGSRVDAARGNRAQRGGDLGSTVPGTSAPRDRLL